MKNTILFLLFTCTQLSSQSADSLLARYIQSGRPGTAHQKLDVLEGKWQVLSREWPEGADGKAVEYTGNSKAEWILGGRFMRLNMEGMQFGQAFTAFCFLGYNNFQKKYIAAWMDNSSTSFFITEGLLNVGGDTLTMTGLSDDPGTGQTNKVWKTLWVLGKNKVELIYLDPGLPPEKSKLFEIILKKP